MLDKIKCFETELSYIKTDWIRDLTKIVINHIPDYFFEIPASSTGKYHPAYTLSKAGLAKHVKAACKIAKDVLSLDSINAFVDSDNEYMKDFMLSAILLHDACKNGYPEQSKYTKHEHPILAADLIRDSLESYLSKAELDGDDDRYDNIRQYIDIVCDLVSSHMGEWNTSKYSDVILPKPESYEEVLVHLFDYLASRKYINVDIFAE